MAQGAPGKPGELKEPRGAELEEKDFILDVSGLEKLKIKSFLPREPKGGQNRPGSPGKPNWRKRI